MFLLLVAHALCSQRPTLLSRFGTLVSQTYSLSSSLTSGSSAFLPSQLDAAQRSLEDEAKSNNYFMSDEASLRAQSAEGVPQVNFIDERNPLPELAAVPVAALDGERAARLREAFRTKLDPDVSQAHDEVLLAKLGGQGMEDMARRSLDEQLSALLKAIRAHDDVAARALRAWYHVRWRPDEDDQTYEFRMRLPEGDRGYLDDDGEGEEGRLDGVGEDRGGGEKENDDGGDNLASASAVPKSEGAEAAKQYEQGQGAAVKGEEDVIAIDEDDDGGGGAEGAEAGNQNDGGEDDEEEDFDMEEVT